jgi:hypothetical protein
MNAAVPRFRIERSLQFVYCGAGLSPSFWHADGGGRGGVDTTLTLSDLAGSIAPLLWGVHMVQSGIERAFGPNLRRFLGRHLAQSVLGSSRR